jgi:hypothetical protein
MKRVVCVAFSLTLLISFSALTQESITLTTYYPAPFGVYTEVRSKRMAIGENYYDQATYPWVAGVPIGNEIHEQTDLVVEGKVGIGMINPETQLDVVGAIRSQWLLLQGKRNKCQTAGLHMLDIEDNYRGWSINNRQTGTYDGVNCGNYNDAFLLSFRQGPPGAATWKRSLMITPAGDVSIGDIDPRAKLDVNGGIKIGNDTATCDASRAGTMRYNANAASQKMKYCNNSSGTYEWEPLSSSSLGWVTIDGCTAKGSAWINWCEFPIKINPTGYCVQKGYTNFAGPCRGNIGTVKVEGNLMSLDNPTQSVTAFSCQGGASQYAIPNEILCSN